MPTWRKGDYTITNNPQDVDMTELHRYLSEESYWSKNVPLHIVERSVQNSLPFCVLDDTQNFIGFARVITDRATFAYLGDVYIHPEFQRKGLGKWLVSVVMDHPDLKDLRNWILFTKDAHELYTKFGWTAGADQDRIMTIQKSAGDIHLI
ncbi:MAG: GNAT family N-acetyltransferase [Candidatus Kariarchaeaceae archaeon]|jgi:GNAT superfamily N-acetyltransferase